MSNVKSYGIFALCFGYFASYVPYSMMTKLATSGDGGLSGFEIQPAVAFGTFLSMFVFLTWAGWWKYATQWSFMGISLPRPRWFTLISGLCTSLVIVTTTLAYTFDGVSIVFAMLLMRGGVLAIAPVVDFAARKRKRKIYWPSWVAALFSLGALLVAFASKASTAMTLVCAIDIFVYLFAYFFRLMFMSNRAKSDDEEEKKRFFTEEQMVANPALLTLLLIVGLIGSTMAPETIPGQVWKGVTTFTNSGYFLTAFFIGIFSYGTGLFGTLIFLDKRENTFTVPANRSASILAGVFSTYLLAAFYKQNYPDLYQLIGVVLIIGAIVFLAYRTAMEKRSRLVKTAIQEA